MLYAFDFILDPRGKMRGFNNVLSLLSQLPSINYSSYYNDVCVVLTNVFTNYETKFAAARLQKPSPPIASTGRKKIDWGKIFGSNADSGSSSSSPLPRRSTTGSASIFNASVSELSSYLDSDTITQYDDDFNILSWWHAQKKLIQFFLS
uniref:Uncharacterized protein n=1 Tax=Arundo donax TaxID=35708 RepID=A0A0A9GJQ5_ARUDO